MLGKLASVLLAVSALSAMDLVFDFDSNGESGKTQKTVKQVNVPNFNFDTTALDQCRADLRKSQSEIQEFSSKIQTTKDIENRFKLLITRLREENVSLTTEITKLTTEITVIKNQAQNRPAENTPRNDALIIELRQKIADLTTENNRLKNDRNGNSDNIKTLKSRIDVLESSLADSQKTVEDLTTKLTTSAKFLSDLRAENRRLQDENAALKNSLRELNNKCQNSDDSAQKMALLVKELTRLKSLEKTWESEKNDFLARLKDCNGSTDGLKAQIKKLTADNTKLFEDNRLLTADKRNLFISIEKLKGKLTEIVQRIAEVESENANLKNQIESLNVVVNSLKVRIANYENNDSGDSKWSVQITELKKVITQYEDQIEKLKRERTTNIKQVADLTNQVNELNIQITQIKFEMQNIKVNCGSNSEKTERIYDAQKNTVIGSDIHFDY